ncbi:MAG TPA: sugar ABC transporter ATP-binding protein [Polyangia bacterium]|nr:sugar ABC transporter ATP-binding protein [Polyangia bacterium]
MTPAPLLAARGIVKRFPGVVAVDHLDLTINQGEVMALLGANGAGKSTFIQILAGVHAHGTYEGEILLEGRPFRPTSVAQAQALGVALVAQEVNVVPELSVAENMFLNSEPTRFGFIDVPGRLAEARRILAEFDVGVDAAARMGTLDLATQQLVSIARALSKKARLLILDEPTAALTDNEVQRLFERMRALRARGVTCIFVSHRLAEVFTIADRIVVMRDGRAAGEYPARADTRDDVVRAMLGTTIAAEHRGDAPAARGDAALEVRDLYARDPDQRRRPPVSGVSLSVGKGEILGLFGLLGAGCNELAQAIFGAWPGAVEGRVLVDGCEVKIASPAAAIGYGIGLVAQDRRESLVHEHTIAENIVLACLATVTRRKFLDVPKMRRLATDFMQRLAIRAPGIDTPVGTLSGGNQQKVQVARWLATGARILLLVDPTRGIDVGARHEINQLWKTLSQEGCALLLVSSEAEELVDVCHRVTVLRNGSAVGDLTGADITEERLLRLAAGV